MKKHISVLAGSLLILALTQTASAHVTVWPKETNTGAYEKYTVRVPVEKDSNTTKVRVEFPAGVKVSTVQPMEGWSYAFEKDADGYNKALVWTAAAGGGIKPHEFMEFFFIGANPKEAGTLTWKASQTYADGTKVDWAGAPGSQNPASVTTIQKGPAGDGSHDAAGTQEPVTSESGADESTEESSSNLPTILSGAALLIALIALFRKR